MLIICRAKTKLSLGISWVKMVSSLTWLSPFWHLFRLWEAFQMEISLQSSSWKLPKSSPGLYTHKGVKRWHEVKKLLIGCPVSMPINWNKRKRLHKKRVQLPQDWFGTQTWPPFNFFWTPIWPPWRHVKTLSKFSIVTHPVTSIDMILNDYWSKKKTQNKFSS